MKFTKTLIFCFLTMLFSAYTQAQEAIIISGKVIDEKGLPIPGANILLKGTNKAVASDFDGTYQIKAGPNSTLVFSYMGYNPKHEPINGRTEIDVTLTPSSQELKEIVVTALGIKRETKALGYATQKISGESLQKVSGVDVATSLTGKVAGLLVKNTPDFGVAPDIILRGEKPLLVIDGIPYTNKTLNDISSEDIESISVLKGGTAAALYGFRGQSGAIMVTTKNGSSKKSGLDIDYTTNTMFSAGFLAIPKKQSLYGRGSNNEYDKDSFEAWGGLMDGSIREQWDPILQDYRNYEYLPVGKDNFKNYLQQGYITNNNFSIGFKGENGSLRSSVNWVETKGQYPNHTMDKYTYTLGGDINFEKFKLSSNVSYARKFTPNMGSNGYTSYDPMYSLLIWSAADYNILDYKDNYWMKGKEGQVQNFTYRPGNISNNPYFDSYEKNNEVTRNLFNADVTMSYQITDWLKGTIRSGLDFYTDLGRLKISQGSYQSSGNTGIPGNAYPWIGGMTGAYATGQTKGSSMNTDFLLTGERAWKKFNIEYLAGGTINKWQNDNINASTVGGINTPGYFSLKASILPALVGASTTGQQVNSIYGRTSLSWDKTIFVDITGRNDWSSTLAKPYFYPSVAASFVISEFLPESTKSWINLLKIRDSWTVGKTPAGVYKTTENSVYSINTNQWNNLTGASYPDKLYPADLLPESSSTIELGLQAILLKKRLNFDLTYYDKNMSDFITTQKLSPTTGYNGFYVNSSEKQSRRGWELTLSGVLIKNKNWQWDLGTNWTTFKRVYTQIDPLATWDANKPWVKVGGRVDSFTSNDFLRDPSGNLIFSNGALQKSQYSSNFGWTDPDYIWGTTSNLKYKAFSLFLSFDGVIGGLINARTESYMWQSGVHPDSLTPERALDVATPGSKNYTGAGVMVVSGAVTYDPIGNITSDDRVYAPNNVQTTYRQYVNGLHSSDAWYGGASRADTYAKTFLKLREVSFSYAIPSKHLQGLGVKAASVSLIGQNVFLWSKDFKYSDPDGSGGSGNGNATGRAEDFSDPAARYIGANVKLTF